MNGSIKFDVANDKDIQEMCKWVNDHHEFTFDLSFDGRYINMEFKRDDAVINLKKGE